MNGNEILNDDSFAAGINEINQSLSSGENGAAPDTTLPEKFNNIPRADFEKALVEATKGNIKGISDVFTLRDKAAKADAMEQEYLSLKQKSEVNPFKNDFVKKLNDLYDKGATDAEIDKFVAVQKIDLAKMSPLQKVQRSIELQFPEMSNEEVSAYIEESFGGSDEENLTAAQKAKITMEARKAEEHIKGFIADAGTPQSERQQKAQMQEYEKVKNVWGKVIGDHQNQFTKTTYEFKVGEKVVKVDFEIPAETQKNIMPQIMQMAVGNKMPVGLKSFNEIKQFHQKMVSMLHLDQIVALAVSAAQADTKNETVKKYAGMVSNNNTGGRNNPFSQEPRNNRQQNTPPKSGNEGGVKQANNFFSGKK